MIKQLAGRWQQSFVSSLTGMPIANELVTVTLAGTLNAATLYTDENKSVPLTNPFSTDANGNGGFYADEGLYDLYARGALVGTVEVIGRDETFVNLDGRVALVTPNQTTSVNTRGAGVTSVGTLSHPTVIETYGLMTNFASAASANATTGTGTADTMFELGTIAAGFGNGFVFKARLAWPDASYDNTGASTGSRNFVGLTSGTMALSVSGDTPAGVNIGFQRNHVNGARTDTTWKLFLGSGGVQVSLTDTTMAFAVAHVYDFYLLVPAYPNATSCTWRVRDRTAGTRQSGSVSLTGVSASTWMRSGFQLSTINAVARNVRMGHLYTETDR